LFLLAGCNVAVAFLLQLMVFASIGPGKETDAFVAASTVPQLLLGIVSIALSSTLVPWFSGMRSDQQNEDVWLLLLILGGLFFAVSLFFFATATWWVALLFPGFDVRTEALCADLLRIQMFSLVFSTGNAAISAVCQARSQFRRVEFIVLASLLLAIGFLYVALPEYGVVAAAWASLLLALTQMILLLPILGVPVNIWTSGGDLAKLWRRIKPILAGNAYSKTDILVDRYLVSMGRAGDMSLLGLAQLIFSGVSGVLSKIWGQTAIPGLSIFAKQGDRSGFVRLLRNRLLILLVVPSMLYLALLLLGKPVLSIVNDYGKMTPANMDTLWMLMAYLGGAFVFGCAGTVISGAFYAMADTRTPMRVSVAVFTLFIFVKYEAFVAAGAVGVAIAISVYYAVNAILLACLLPYVIKRRVYAR